MNKVIGVIPARYASTRFPGKPLVSIEGRPLLEWVIRGVKESKLLSSVIVATDHAGIANLAKALGVEVKMTDPDLPSGSDRVWAAVKDLECEAIVNIQGDEPLIQGALIDRLIEDFYSSKVQMGTLVRPLALEDLTTSHVVKALLNQHDEAIYFSRLPIPYTRLTPEEPVEACWQHIGLYIYQKSFLKVFCETPPPLLERAESLEQLRALWLGAKIRATKTNYRSMGVDTPEDILKVASILKGKLIHENS